MLGSILGMALADIERKALSADRARGIIRTARAR